MLFKPRGVQQHKEERPKNQMTLADMLAFRDTWTDIPQPDFSLERTLLKVRLERQKKAEVPKLMMSANGFRVRDKADMEASEVELRRIQSSLNKLTDQNFDSVSSDILSHELICDVEVLKGAVNIIFTKAVAEPVFSSLYARLCARIGNYEREVVAESEKDPQLRKRLEAAQAEFVALKDASFNIGGFVRTVLIVRCQNFYEQFSSQAPPESAEAEEHLRKQNMANIKFVGELYVKSILNISVVSWLISGAMALGWDAKSTKTTVSDVDLELAYNLLLVVGKKYDESAKPELVSEAWASIQQFAEDKAFSMRVRCLLQNLLDLRKNAWVSRDFAHASSSSANTDQASGHNSPPPPGQQQGRQMPRTMSTQQQDGYGAWRNNKANPMAGARRQDRVTSFQELDQFGPGGRNFPPPPPPPPPPQAPFNVNAPAPPFSAGPVPGADAAALMVAAQPPPAFDAEKEKSMLSVLRDAVADGDWTAAAASAQALLPGEPLPVCVACAAAAAMKRVCMSSSEDDHATFGAALDNSTFFHEKPLTRGYAWFLTEAVSNNYKEDVPRVISRFVARVAATASLDAHVMLRDVMLRAAVYLDALYATLDGEAGEWDESFIEVWSSVLLGWNKARGKDHDSKGVPKIIESLAEAERHRFVTDMMPDLLMELNQDGFLSDTAINNWLDSNGSDGRYQVFAEQLRQLFSK